jgi:DNA polymerase epsilon subunit 1
LQVWLQLLAELRSLGAKIISASFHCIRIATDKASVAAAAAYAESVRDSIHTRDVFGYLGFEPVRYWSALLYVDRANYAGVRHLTQHELAVEIEEAEMEAQEAVGVQGGVEGEEWAGYGEGVGEEEVEGGVGDEGVAALEKVKDPDGEAEEEEEEEEDLLLAAERLAASASAAAPVGDTAGGGDDESGEPPVRVERGADGTWVRSDAEIEDVEPLTGGEEEAGGALGAMAAAAALMQREGDSATARADGRWNIAEFLPPRVQPELLSLAAAFASQPWAVAAEAALLQGQMEPSLDAVAKKTAAYFDSIFAMRAIEAVAEVRTTLSSAEKVLVRVPTDGEGLTEEEETSFPQAAGSHLPMSSPALELTKTVCHLISLDPLISDAAIRLRRNLLKLLGTPEFSAAARFANPCRTFVLPDAACDFCQDARDLDICRDATPGREWPCAACGSPRNPEKIEARLVAVVQARGLAFLSQDRVCRKCKVVQRTELQQRCPGCAGHFSLRKPAAGFAVVIDTFSGIADHFEMPMLAEVCAWLRTDALHKFDQVHA